MFKKGRKLSIKATCIMHSVFLSVRTKRGKVESSWFSKLPCKQKISFLQDFSNTVHISPRRAEHPLLGIAGVCYEQIPCFTEKWSRAAHRKCLCFPFSFEKSYSVSEMASTTPIAGKENYIDVWALELIFEITRKFDHLDRKENPTGLLCKVL